MEKIEETIEGLRAAAAQIEALPKLTGNMAKQRSAISEAVRAAQATHRALDAEGLEPEDFEAYTASRAQAHKVCDARRALGNALGIAVRSMFTTTDPSMVERELRRLAAHLRRHADAEMALVGLTSSQRSVA